MKKDKKSVGSREFDSERETRVLLEDVRSQVQIVAEGHGAIMRKLDEHGRILEEHGRILEDHSRILEDHGRILGDHSSRFGRLETDMQCVKAAVLETSQRVRSIENKLDNHETRITKLEEKVHV